MCQIRFSPFLPSRERDKIGLDNNNNWSGYVRRGRYDVRHTTWIMGKLNPPFLSVPVCPRFPVYREWLDSHTPFMIRGRASLDQGCKPPGTQVTGGSANSGGLIRYQRVSITKKEGLYIMYNIGPLSWAALTGMEPRLKSLGLLVEEVRKPSDDSEVFCKTVYWHRAVKPLLDMLIGKDRPRCHPFQVETKYEHQMYSESAYLAACTHLYHMLPKCRDCSCPHGAKALHRMDKQRLADKQAKLNAVEAKLNERKDIPNAFLQSIQRVAEAMD